MYEGKYLVPLSNTGSDKYMRYALLLLFSSSCLAAWNKILGYNWYSFILHTVDELNVSF